MPRPLPREIIDQIVSYVDPADHVSCLTVNSTFFHAAIPHLYRHISLQSDTKAKWPIVLKREVENGDVDPEVAKETEAGPGKAKESTTTRPVLFTNACITSVTGDLGRSVLRHSWLLQYTRFLDLGSHPTSFCGSDDNVRNLRKQGIRIYKLPNLPKLDTLRLTMNGISGTASLVAGGQRSREVPLRVSNWHTCCRMLEPLRPTTLILRGDAIDRKHILRGYKKLLSAVKKLVLVGGTFEGEGMFLWDFTTPPNLRDLTVVQCTGSTRRFLNRGGVDVSDEFVDWHLQSLVISLGILWYHHTQAFPERPFTVTEVIVRDTDADDAVMQAAIARNPETAPLSSPWTSPQREPLIECFNLLAHANTTNLEDSDAEDSGGEEGPIYPDMLRILSGEEYLAREDWQLAFRHTELFP